ISCSELLNQPPHGNRKTRLHYLLETLGLKTTAHYKHVPEVIYRCSSAVRAAFLAGLLDSDGCFAQSNRGSGLCSLSSVSGELLEGVRRLCQLEGIAVSLRTNRLLLWNLEKLHEVIGPHLVIKSFTGKLNSGATGGWIPRENLLAGVVQTVGGQGASGRRFFPPPTFPTRTPLLHSSLP